MPCPGTASRQILKRLARPLYQHGAEFFFRPSLQITWKPFALRAAARLLARERFDMIFVTAPPFVCLDIGLTLKRLSGLPFVADFRDFWTWHDAYRSPTALHTLYDRHLEKNIAREADAVIVVNDAMQEKFVEQYGRQGTVRVIHNGYDTEDFTGLHPANGRRGRLTLAHIGSFHAARDIRPLVQLFSQLAMAKPAVAKKITFVPGYRRLVRRY